IYITADSVLFANYNFTLTSDFLAVLKNKTQGLYVNVSKDILLDQNINLRDRGMLVGALAEKYKCAIVLIGHMNKAYRYGKITDIDIVSLLAANLSETRERVGITQKQLSEKTGIYQADISKIERGIGNPSLSTLKRLADGMGVVLNIGFVIE
ncbi:MAG TPA: helix-turn-helix transcriptional regulator, partial [Lachnospiraceae bacterium]|nr:helix-turn-helix transcriptional regulator [Lachnospiraceae bacterium]